MKSYVNWYDQIKFKELLISKVEVGLRKDNKTMAKKETALTIPKEVILNQIYYLRGHKVMLDVHLAELYNVENRALKQAVRRNMETLNCFISNYT